MKDDGLYYLHDCPKCGGSYHDALPCLYCLRCYSPDVVVTFDAAKRATALARMSGCKTAAEMEGSNG